MRMLRDVVKARQEKQEGDLVSAGTLQQSPWETVAPGFPYFVIKVQTKIRTNPWGAHPYRLPSAWRRAVRTAPVAAPREAQGKMIPVGQSWIEATDPKSKVKVEGAFRHPFRDAQLGAVIGQRRSYLLYRQVRR